jgi:rare lipoprotein A
VRVRNLETGREVTVRINDRGPTLRDRIVDVSQAAARSLGMLRSGLARVRLTVVE